MRPMTPDRAARFNRMHAEAMQDTCRILRRNGTTSTYTPDGTTTPCRWNDSGMGAVDGTNSSRQAAELALPHSTVINRLDQIEVLSRNGQPITPELYNQVDLPMPAAHVLIVTIQRAQR